MRSSPVRTLPPRAPEGPVELSVPGFVGRNDALTTITGAQDDGPALVLVEGEAGVGKSRLVQELFAASALDRSRALVAVCPPFRELLTLGPVVDAVRQSGVGVAGLGLSALAGALRPVFPEWADVLPAAPEPLEDAKAARHRLLSALAELVGRLGVGLLVVEDAHWADEATVEFLLLLTSRQDPPSLVVTYRPEDVPDGSLLWRLSSRAVPGVRRARVVLEPLDLADTARLVSSMLGSEPVSEGFAGFLHAHTDGLPLLVEESVRLLHDRADLIREDGQWVRRRLAELEVPPTVRDAVRERVDRLGPAARRVLEAAAVLAEPADEVVLRRVAGLAEEQAGDGLSEALASGLLGEDGRRQVAFRHDLMGRVVYEAIPAPQRRRLHLAAGRALEGADPLPVVPLARHFREAGEPAKWAEYAERAAEHAVDSNDHTTAGRLLNDVLATASLPADTVARLAPMLARATLFRSEDLDNLNREVVGTLRALLAARRLDRPAEADIRNPLGRLLIQLGDWENGYRELELAAANLGHDPVEAARVMTYLGFPLVGSRPASAHRHWLRRAAELDPSGGSPVDRVMLTADRATGLVLLGDEEGWGVAARLPTTASTRAELRELARACSNLAYVSIVWGRYADADALLVRALELAEEAGYTALRSGVQSVRVRLDWFTGGWDGLADRLTALLDMQDGRASGNGGVQCAMGRLRAAQAAREEAERYFCRALDTARRQGLVDDALEPAAQLGRLRLAAGCAEDAVRVTDDAMQTLVGKGIWVWATEIAPVRVAALVAAGRAEEAGRLVASFGRGLRGRDAPAPRAALALCRATLAEHREGPARAATAYSRVADAWARLPRPYDVLLARERQARCLLASGAPDAGLALLCEVFGGFTELGASGDADRTAEELRRHGVEVRRRPGGRPAYGDQLSPRELEVVRLLVTGRTDRQIAAELFLSPKTVGRHLDSARRKLKVPSRTALAVAVVEAGLVAEQAPAGGR